MDPFTIPNSVPLGFCSTRGHFIDIPALMVGFILPVEWKEETEDMMSKDSSIVTRFHSSHTSLIDVYFVLKVCRLFLQPLPTTWDNWSPEIHPKPTWPKFQLCWSFHAPVTWGLHKVWAMGQQHLKPWWAGRTKALVSCTRPPEVQHKY